MEERGDDENGLLQKCVQEIAVATAAAIGYDVIITDMDAVVVGASKAARIGEMHEASLEVISSGGNSETTEYQAQDLSGTLPGVTYPIHAMNGKIVGTMAITGDPGKVRPFALIVKKQIEILLRERELYAYSVNRESTLQNLIQDLSSFVPGVSNETVLTARASEFGYDPSWYYVPVAVDLYQFGRYALQIRKESQFGGKDAETKILRIKKAVLASVRRIFSQRRDVSTISSNNRFVVLCAAENSVNGLEHEAEVMAKVREMSETLLRSIETLGLRAAIGLGSPALGIQALAGSFQESWKALFLGKKFCQSPGVYNIKDFRLEDVISTLDTPVRSRFIQSVTGKLRKFPDWEEMRDTIKGWCESGFSLIEASRRLHIHRNTLIYRLEKMNRITGLDMKDFKTCLNLYLALVMDQYVGPAVREQEIQ